MTRPLIVVFFLTTFLFSCKKEEEGELCKVVTTTATANGYFSSELHGEVTAVGSGILNRGFSWGRSSSLMAGSDVQSVAVGAGSVGDFHTTVSGLDPDYNYYYRAFATTSAGTTYGDIHSCNPYSPYQQLSNTPFAGRYGGIGFTIGNKGYVGLGYAGGSDYKSDFWEYDSATSVWTPKANFPAALLGAVGFSIGGKGYVGLGLNSGVKTAAIWEYDPAGDTWTSKASYPFPAAYAACFVIAGKAYVGTGNINTGSGYSNALFEFDPVLNSWTAKANYPGVDMAQGTGFAIGSKGYFGLGDGPGIYSDELWEYDCAANAWTQKQSFPYSSSSPYVQSFVINNKAYVGLAYNSAVLGMYDPMTNTWQKAADFEQPGYGFSTFAFSNKAYIGLGYAYSGYSTNFYSFTPLN